MRPVDVHDVRTTGFEGGIHQTVTRKGGVNGGERVTICYSIIVRVERYRYIINGRKIICILIGRELFFVTTLSASTLSLAFIFRFSFFFVVLMTQNMVNGIIRQICF